MTMLRRPLYKLSTGLLCLSACLLAACSVPSPLARQSAAQLQKTAAPEVRQALAPTGSLRVGVYVGSPTSMVREPKTGEAVGVALNLGQALARQLDVPVQVVEFARLAQVLEAVKAGAVDFTFTNATEIRARDMDFTDPLIQLELGYLVSQAGPMLTVADIDRAGVRVGVAQGSSSQGTLGRLYKNATIVPAASLTVAQQMLSRGELDAFATNKGILFEMAEGLAGFHVLPGRWGVESLAIAVPKGRDVAKPFLRQFAAQARASGLLQSIALKAGLRGTAQAD
jgi:polar amino acid transport system substrate-binding protein